MTSIDYFEQLIKNILDSQNKELLESSDTIYTIMTAKFNVGKNFSRYQTSDKDQRIGMLKKSLQAYEWIRSFIQERKKANIEITTEIEQTYKSCMEMCELLPAKIDKVAQGII